MQVNLPLWLDYIEAQIGFVLPITSRQWFGNAVIKTALHHKMSVEQLFDEIKTNALINQSLIDAITINETRFFRDKHAIDCIGDLYYKRLTDKTVTDVPFSVVSIGSSTGQEIWSVGLTCQYIKDCHVKDTHKTTSRQKAFRLIGLDVSQASITVAKIGQYPAKALDDIDSKFYPYLYDTDSFGSHWQVVSTIRDCVCFELCNVFKSDTLQTVLVQLNCPNPDVIICQNVLIYFRRFDQRDILSRMASVLSPQGVLLLGAGEGLFWHNQSLEKMNNPAINGWIKK